MSRPSRAAASARRLGGLALVHEARTAAGSDPFEVLAVRRLSHPVEPRDFPVPTLDGGRLGLADLRGKAMLLNFGATWCPVCYRALGDGAPAPAPPRTGGSRSSRCHSTR